MAEADGAETPGVNNVRVQSSVDLQVDQASERKEGKEEGAGASSQVYTATSLSLQAGVEKHLMTHPLVRLTHRTIQKM